MHIGDVAVLAAAEFDPERIDQHEAGEARGRAHHDLGRDPAAKARADQHRILEAQLGREIEIEIGEVVDRAQAVDQRGTAPARMARRDHPEPASQ